MIRRKVLTRQEIEENIKDNLPEIKSRFKVKSIGVFGSVARNSHTPASDVDVLVEFAKGHKDFFNYARLKEFLEESLGANVDLVIKEAVKPALKDSIFKEVRYV